MPDCQVRYTSATAHGRGRRARQLGRARPAKMCAAEWHSTLRGGRCGCLCLARRASAWPVSHRPTDAAAPIALDIWTVGHAFFPSSADMIARGRAEQLYGPEAARPVWVWPVPVQILERFSCGVFRTSLDGDVPMHPSRAVLSISYRFQLEEGVRLFGRRGVVLLRRTCTCA